MRPGNNSTTTAAAVNAGFWHWNSPVTYLFVSLAVILGLITVALVILACSYRKSLANSSRNQGGDQEKPPKQVEIEVVDYEPKVVVIMAGDENPTYLAKPMRPTTNFTSSNNIWHSPIPYLFGSIALVLILISVALIVLACSYYRKQAATSSSGNQEQEDPAKPVMISSTLDTTPKIVVIMAGNDTPTYLATPAATTTTSSLTFCTCEQ
ncbi:hypothetical protein Tsubulata_021639, partial [Turnera subulata]